MMNVVKIKDQRSNDALVQKGYAIIPFLDDIQVKSLVQLFEDNHKEIPAGLYASAHHPDIAFRNKLSKGIASIINQEVENNLSNAKLLGGTFMSKMPGDTGTLPPHQDWNIVDEEIARSYNLWIPLVDVEENNGTIEVIDGSHEWEKTIRGPGIQEPNSDESLWEQMIPLKLNAGEALLYDHRLVHGSKANKSDSNRLVVVVGINPQNEPMRIYYNIQNNIEAYHCSEEFFMNNNPWDGPNGLTRIKPQGIFTRLLNKVFQKH